MYGGGYGKQAEMVGSPSVNINVIEDGTTEAQTYYKETIDDDGNESTPEVPVYVSNFAGDTIKIDEGLQTEHEVIRPSHVKGKMGAIQRVFGGGNAAKVTGDTYVNIGTKVGEGIDLVSKPIKDGNNKPTYQKATVKGVDIRDNVYGGGNNAEVTGNTHVVIGKKATSSSGSGGSGSGG